MARSVLITGGAGFIGSHTADLFLSKGNRVSIVDDFSTGKRDNVAKGAVLHEMRIESEECASLIRASKFDLVVHLAAQMDVRKSVSDPGADARINIMGTLNLLESVRSCGHGTRLIFSSTGGAVYGAYAPLPAVETAPKDPESPYAVSKLAAEYYIALYGRVHGIESVVLRLGNVYGPRQDPHGEAGVVAIFCRRLLSESALTVFGDGRQTRDYTYVADVCEAISLASEREIPPQKGVDSRALNIGTGRGTSVIELVAALEKISGKSANTTFAPKRPGEQQDSAIDPGKAARLLGWRVKTDLNAGLGLTYEWFADLAEVGARA